ncbi:Hypothetical predicted protein [Octopus vulgaris]|uniref:Uncharacterized protein n=1 Tax=Octopus vulgaris TaxID=6645 RepID=A0AA36F0X9_OCTVU|nr:Hypothetical predicted protein [Octopus vulgaris]
MRERKSKLISAGFKLELQDVELNSARQRLSDSANSAPIYPKRYHTACNTHCIHRATLSCLLNHYQQQITLQKATKVRTREFELLKEVIPQLTYGIVLASTVSYNLTKQLVCILEYERQNEERK